MTAQCCEHRFEMEVMTASYHGLLKRKNSGDLLGRIRNGTREYEEVCDGRACQ